MPAKKTAKKSAKKSVKKNKLGVKNSLVNNINAKKKKGTSRSAKKSTISKENYKEMENKWSGHKKD
ncbi:MAG: hypothetical protein ABJB05_10835 [Parafilimonas sp.]